MNIQKAEWILWRTQVYQIPRYDGDVNVPPLTFYYACLITHLSIYLFNGIFIFNFLTQSQPLS